MSSLVFCLGVCLQSAKAYCHPTCVIYVASTNLMDLTGVLCVCLYVCAFVIEKNCYVDVIFMWNLQLNG